MHHDWSCSVQPVAGGETPMDLESYQVTEASSDALREIYDGLSALHTMMLSDMIMPSTLRNKEDDEITLIQERSAQYIFEGKQFAFAAITSVHGDNALVVDGGATSTLTKSFDNCTQIRPKVVAIQTASGATAIYTSHVCSKTYFAIDRLGSLRPIVPGLRYDLLSAKGLNKAGYRVIHDEDEHESGIYAVINKKIDPSRSFAFMSEHSIFYISKLSRQMRNNLRSRRDIIYGIEEWDIVRTMLFGHQSNIRLEWNR